MNGGPVSHGSSEVGSVSTGPSVAVVLCARNAASIIGVQLAALAAQDASFPWELVVVDNGSSDGTAAEVRRWQPRLPALTLVSEPRRGLNRARNRGVAASTATRVLCCDADDEVDPGWVRMMAAALDDVDLVGGRLETERLNGPSPTMSFALQADALPETAGFRYAVGANFGFRRSVHDRVGGFDEAMRWASDEIDFCVRAVLAGASIGFEPDAVVHYRLRATAAAVVAQRFRYGFGNQELIARVARYTGSGPDWSARARWIARKIVRLLRRPPRLTDRRARVRYLARVAFTSGEAASLLAELADRHRRVNGTSTGWRCCPSARPRPAGRPGRPPGRR